ncbi:MAG: hypothetical protein U0R19_10470 [Bryobacteraceae bacterium]
MGQLVKSFIARLRSADPDLRQDLWMIPDLLRKGWGQSFPGTCDEIAEEDVSQAEASELRSALLDAFYNASTHVESRSLLDTLAATGEESIRGDLVKQLHLALEMHRAASAQLWVALRSLEDVGEQVFEPLQLSRSIDSVEMNIHAADQYLRRKGILVPH